MGIRVQFFKESLPVGSDLYHIPILPGDQTSFLFDKHILNSVRPSILRQAQDQGERWTKGSGWLLVYH